MSTDDIIHLRGGHDLFGEEVAPLDEKGARAAILARRHRVDAFAVSGYFGVRNPAHENRVRALIHELTDLPVTCGHELTSHLNAVRRATTAALNAHLISPLTELISSLQRTLGNYGIAAPLMVVRSDGSLVRAEWAMRRPIETILSGPAASLVGAWHLAGRQRRMGSGRGRNHHGHWRPARGRPTAKRAWSECGGVAHHDRSHRRPHGGDWVVIAMYANRELTC